MTVGFRPATIAVSGYPQVSAVRAGSACGVAAMRGEELATYLRRAARVLAGGSPGEKARCHRCRVWRERKQLEDGQLGLASGAYCTACIAVYVAACQRRHGRLPSREEFLCLGCLRLLPLVVRCPPDLDGRRRYRCLGCRAKQVRKAELRRREKERGP